MGFGYSKQTTDATESIDQDNKDLYMLTHYLSHTKEEDNNIKNILEHKKALDYENIVFEGGGAKAMAFCGGILALDNLGIYKKLKRFAGSSAGAIVATLLAIGYTPSDLVDIMYDTDFGTFFNKSLFELPKDIYEVLKHEGCDSGEAFEDFIETRIETITGNKDYTFIDLYNDRKIELVITSTDVNREISVYFHHKATPHMTLRQAVRMSMSIPLIFTPVVHELAKKQDIFVDGGLLDNYPLHVFDGAYPGDPQAMMNLIAPNPKTIGLKLLTKYETDNLSIAKRVDIKTTKDYIFKLIDTITSATERRYMRPSYWTRTISIKVPYIPLSQFSINKDIKQRMLENGKKYTYKWFK